MSEPSWIGKAIGERYQIEQDLGAGGVSTVFRATDLNLRRTVAVRLIHRHLSRDPEFVRRFEAEGPTITRTPTPTQAPTELAPTEPTTPTEKPPPEDVGLSAQITNIALQDGHYVASYQTGGFTEALPEQHVHFFFDTVSPVNAGVPGSGPWILYGDPRPFTQYTAADRPSAASQMCVLVANPDHSIQLGSGYCYPLPG